ncbi:MAG: glutamate synthase large subunit [Alphaproteobacteria bacterium]
MSENKFDHVAYRQQWQANQELLNNAGINTKEHDACGVGLIVDLNNTARRDVVTRAIEALKAVWHRGAVDADGKTGDGAGIRLGIPQSFFREHVERTGHKVPENANIAVGMVFLPRTDGAAQELCRTIVEREIIRAGLKIYGWRQVPTDQTELGEKANATRPEIEQIMIEVGQNQDPHDFERRLYVIRRRIEKAVNQENIGDFYICSLSNHSVIYKGMFLAEHIDSFYIDLKDPRFQSTFALYHQRYSTNTFPTWKLAQPFRVLAHNGEINTIKGNENWMACHETRMGADIFSDDEMDAIKPVIQKGNSDSASLDGAAELLTMSGRNLPFTKSMLVPEAWAHNKLMPQAHKDMYAYCNSVMEPWDGPAALCAVAGDWAVAGLDRNGLRPIRYAITGDGMLIAGSETGMVRVDEAEIKLKGRVGPGQMIAVNITEGKFYTDNEIKDELSATLPFGKWVGDITHLDDMLADASGDANSFENQYDAKGLRTKQLEYAQSVEDLELILQPMIETGKEALGSMGDDTPMAVISESYRGLHHYFRQGFSQVTNPPIDSLREWKVMSLSTRLGNLRNVLEDSKDQCDILQLESPVLTNNDLAVARKFMGKTAFEIDCTFEVADSKNTVSGITLQKALDRIRMEAEQAVRRGCLHIILSDMNTSADRAAIPMILATGAVHSHLMSSGLRTYTSLCVRSGECLDTQFFAVLVGVGATTVNAYLAEENIIDRHRKGLFDDLSLAQSIANYKESINQGLLKIMSKMGIGVIASYRGGYNFEAVGLSRTLVNEFFPGVPSRISGIGLAGLEAQSLKVHARAHAEDYAALPIGGLYRYRKGGEQHAWEAGIMHTLQAATESGSYSVYKKYSDAVGKLPPTYLRDLLDFKSAGQSSSGEQGLDIDEVESITEIRKRFITPGMSLGALSPEAHGTLNVAMNRIGAKSVSGEGGEIRSRYTPDENGDNANSAIKQIASGRFGVTAEYLNQCREIEIKMAQGAKPGEGGQLPGFKVTKLIAELRHSTPGVMLISPPPHHDIYSIEDLAQLIYDLKQINPDCRVCVKLVARDGIGTIAAGVAKAKADTILVSGYSGGTGASPQTSIKHVGLPWEMGLSEVHQVLTTNRLRHQVKLRTDGGLRTGRDIVMAAMLGAEEFGLGTGALIAMGCIMVRQCHSNTCPVGVCVQDEELRKKFTGTADKVVNLFSFVAEEVREILASLGFSCLEDVVGRTDLLSQVSRGAANLDDLDLNAILAKADSGGLPTTCQVKGRNEVPETLDADIIKDAAALFERGEKMQLAYTVRNTHRSVGSKLSSKMVRQFGRDGLKPGHIKIQMRGSAGQSLGAFGVQGLKLVVVGDANDYVGKGLSGATIVVRPLSTSKLTTNDNTIIGNTVLYGATSGKLFAAGQAGERFCVRNSGAQVVVEGCGSNGCEYMTGGTTVILGSVGENFGAGMSGGIAYVYDRDGLFDQRANEETIIWQNVVMPHYQNQLKSLIEEHVAETGSQHAKQLLDDWKTQLSYFKQIVPKEMLTRLEHPVNDTTDGKKTA